MLTPISSRISGRAHHTPGPLAYPMLTQTIVKMLMASDLSLRGRFAPVAISGRQCRFVPAAVKMANAKVWGVAALTAQPLAALPPYGCGVPFTGGERHAGWHYLRHKFIGARPPSLSFRGAKRRGNLLQPVTFSPRPTCYSTWYCEIATSAAPPRNDKPGSLEPPNRCCDACSCIIPLRRGRAHSPQSGARRP